MSGRPASGWLSREKACWNSPLDLFITTAPAASPRPGPRWHGTHTTCGCTSCPGRWQRVAQVEAFVGRAAEVGDDLGSRVIAAQIVLDAMHLALLQHRAYAPYSKWLGTAFKKHETDDSLTAPLAVTLAADSASSRQEGIVAALLELSRRHDQLAVTEPVQSQVETFFTRPYPVIWCERIAEALHNAITDSQVAALTFGLGGIDEITNSTDALKNSELRGHVMSQYR